MLSNYWPKSIQENTRFAESYLSFRALILKSSCTTSMFCDYIFKTPSIILHENAKHNQFLKAVAAKHTGRAKALNVIVCVTTLCFSTTEPPSRVFKTRNSFETGSSPDLW